MAEISVITCSFLDKTSLYLAYMPFVSGGGLFIRTHPIHALDTEVRLIIRLMSEQEPYTMLGKVVWVTPKAALGNKPMGIGVQFIENNRVLIAKIEGYIEDLILSSQPTDTL